jgi:hypothetical protein
VVAKALHVEPLLGKRREFQAKGERRQRALLSNEAFPLALGFAQLDYFLGCEDMQYWRDRHAQLREEHPNGLPRRRRRRPRKPRGPKTDSQEVRS